MTQQEVVIMKLYKNYQILLFSLIAAITSGCATTTVDKNAKSTPYNSGEKILIVEHNPLIPTRLTSAGIQTGRYSSIQSKPTHSQRDLLQVMITVSIPEEIKSVGQTIRYLLRRSGYQLANPNTQKNKVTAFFIKSLPRVHRQIGPMTLEDALITLMSPAFTLHSDPVHRLISYRLNDNFSGEVL